MTSRCSVNAPLCVHVCLCTCSCACVCITNMRARQRQMLQPEGVCPCVPTHMHTQPLFWHIVERKHHLDMLFFLLHRVLTCSLHPFMSSSSRQSSTTPAAAHTLDKCSDQASATTNMRENDPTFVDFAHQFMALTTKLGIKSHVAQDELDKLWSTCSSGSFLEPRAPMRFWVDQMLARKIKVMDTQHGRDPPHDGGEASANAPSPRNRNWLEELLDSLLSLGFEESIAVFIPTLFSIEYEQPLHGVLFHALHFLESMSAAQIARNTNKTNSLPAREHPHVDTQAAAATVTAAAHFSQRQ
jgi:hypothetical protein